MNCHIRLNIDWSEIDCNLNGATMYVYREDGYLFKAFQPFPNPHCIEFALPKGKYELILHNNAPFELPNLRFAGLEKRHTLAVYVAANKDDTSQYKKVMEPDVFGLAGISELQVTEKMIEYFPYKP
ncbi:MAG: DUF5119 domain-containing protein, partial [Bacteroidales bacterium]